MKWYYLIMGILAVWRITFLLSMEDGPFEILHLIREKAGTGFLGSLLNCFFCLSIWIAIPFGIWLGETIQEILLLTLSFSGGACIIERFSDRDQKYPAVQYFEEEDEEK